jgi:hypothetical protein
MIIVIVILLVFIGFTSTKNHNIFDYMVGFWTADKDFLQTSSLSSAYVLLEPKENGQIDGFLTMISSEDKTVSDQKITISNLHPTRIGNGFYKLNNINIDYENNDVMPTSLDIDIDVNSGIMVMTNDEKIYAVFVKDNETSSKISE